MISGQQFKISLVSKHISACVRHICRCPNDVKSDVTYEQVADPCIVDNAELI